ncbi:MAG TPA: hypothetical protein PLM83_08835, partial [Bacillota bacterium]|nr:hypothetical protein [Bacillota bacterium]
TGTTSYADPSIGHADIDDPLMGNWQAITICCKSRPFSRPWPLAPQAIGARHYSLSGRSFPMPAADRF